MANRADVRPRAHLCRRRRAATCPLRRSARLHLKRAANRWPNRVVKFSAGRVRGESMANRADVRPRAQPCRRRRAATCLLRMSVRSHLKRAVSRRPKRVVKSFVGQPKRHRASSRVVARLRLRQPLCVARCRRRKCGASRVSRNQACVRRNSAARVAISSGRNVRCSGRTCRSKCSVNRKYRGRCRARHLRPRSGRRHRSRCPRQCSRSGSSRLVSHRPRLSQREAGRTTTHTAVVTTSGGRVEFGLVLLTETEIGLDHARVGGQFGARPGQ